MIFSAPPLDAAYTLSALTWLIPVQEILTIQAMRRGHRKPFGGAVTIALAQRLKRSTPMHLRAPA